MNQTADYLTNIRRIIKLYDNMLKEICEQYNLTTIEANIISFLYYSPDRDTAGDVVELNMFSKGNVSQAVESLNQKAFLQRIPDTTDRRKIHLSLLPSCKPITNAMEAARAQFREEIFNGFSEDDRKQFDCLNRRIMENTKQALKRRENK